MEDTEFLVRCYYCSDVNSVSQADAESRGWTDVENDWGRPDGNYRGVCQHGACQNKKQKAVSL